MPWPINMSWRGKLSIASIKETRRRCTPTYTHRPSHKKTAVNAVNANATADPNIAEPIDTYSNAVNHPEPPAKETSDPGSKPPPSLWVPCSKHWKQRKQTDMGYHIGWGVTNCVLLTCKLSSKGGQPKGRGGHMGGGGRKGGGGVRVVVAARVIKEERERRTGADGGRGAQRSPLRKKKTPGTPLTLRWLLFLRES